uniref:Cyclin N-terminal domain-containing protein n=1 Tax=Oryza meridionalis TaxID=40149 RepID=A0A0E0CX02_9ORYZ
MTKPRTRSVARMEAAAAAAAAEEEEEEAGNPDGAEGAAVAAVAPEAAAEGPNEPNAGEASREPDAGQASREPGAARPSREPDAAGPSREPGAAGGSRQPVPDAAQLAVVPYVEDIDRYLRSLEAEETRRPMINYVQEIQGGIINMNMRGVLVDWMADVAYVFNLQEETLHHAVSYVDRFLSKIAFPGDKLKLLGTTALFVASKYEEIHPPHVRNFSAVTVNTYTTQQVSGMELDILRFLNFDVGSPTNSSNRKLELMCNYLAELSLLDDYYIRFLPSIVAAACLFVGKFTLNPNTRPWFGSVSTITPPEKIKVCFLKDLTSVARMEATAAAAAAEEEEAGNPDGAEGAPVAAVAPEAAAEGSNEPNAGEASREPDAGQASRQPDVAGPSREPGAAGGPRQPGAAGGPWQLVPNAAGPAVAPYVEDINRYLRFLEAEESRRPIVNYDQEIQGGHINMLMRGKLVNWMAELVYGFNLWDNILYLAVSYVDRFLSRNVVNRERLQLLSTSALFVASKYEDRCHPSARFFSSITADTYTTQQVVAMEANILSFLNFQMGSPTVITFLRNVRTLLEHPAFVSLYSVPPIKLQRPINIRLELMCIYLAELSLLDDYNIRFLPSIVAAACLFVGKFTINPNTHPWNLSVQRITGYKVSDIEDCIRSIHDLQAGRKWSNLRAIRSKYEDDAFERVSTIPSPNTIKPSFLRDLKYVTQGSQVCERLKCPCGILCDLQGGVEKYMVSRIYMCIFFERSTCAYLIFLAILFLVNSHHVRFDRIDSVCTSIWYHMLLKHFCT